MKAVIISASVHHKNTKKIVDAIAKEYDVEVVDATKVKEKDLHSYDLIGFASGIYYSKFHQSILNFASVNLPQNKKVFAIYTYGSKRDYLKPFKEAIKDKNPVVVGAFGCPGFDTFGPFKLVGGLQKGHPDDEDVASALSFYKTLVEVVESNEAKGGKTNIFISGKNN